MSKQPKPSRLCSVPLFASHPAAGFPAPGDDQVEQPLDLNDLLVDDPTATFYVRVSGDSMEGARIFHGDVLVVDRSIEARPEMIVVAAVYGELVVKRLRRYRGALGARVRASGLRTNFDQRKRRVSHLGCCDWVGPYLFVKMRRAVSLRAVGGNDNHPERARGARAGVSHPLQ